VLVLKDPIHRVTCSTNSSLTDCLSTLWGQQNYLRPFEGHLPHIYPNSSLSTLLHQGCLMQPYRAFPRFKGSNYCLTCTPSILCPWLLSLPSPSTIYKDKFPDGIYLSLTPGDPSLWSGVLFVHSGMSTSDASELCKAVASLRMYFDTSVQVHTRQLFFAYRSHSHCRIQSRLH
jgi:hypothetical protein